MKCKLNDEFFEQHATIVAENIICMTRSIGWECMDYAKRLIINIMKKAAEEAAKEKQQ